MANDKPTPDQLERLKAQLLVDKGPSSRQQSYQFVYWKQIGDTLGQPFDMTKIPMSKLYQMRRDPMISFALHYIKVPLIRAPWYIKCDDAQIAAFVDEALRRIYSRLVLQYMLSLDFGFSAIVKRFELDSPVGTYIDPQDPDQEQKPIWSHGNVDAVMWKSFVPLAPQQVEPRWDKTTGEFAGIRYDNKRDVPLVFPVSPVFDRDDTVDVPLNLSLWITNEKDSVFGSPWGYPRIGYAFRYWWSYWYRWALADRHFEKDADPPTIVRYPNSVEDEALDDDGNTIDYRSIALGLGEQARSGSTIAMPSDVVTAIDARLTNLYQWDIKTLEGNNNFDAFDKTFDRLEVLKLRSIWVPEQAFLEGSGGTSSRNVAATMTDSFQEAQAVLMAEFDDHLNRYVIPQLVQINFPEFDGKATKVTKGFGSEDLDMAKALVQAMANSDPTKLEVDFRTVLRDLGIPLKSPALLEAEKEQAIKDAQAMMPPEGVPGQPGQAGTMKAGTDNRNKPGTGSSTGFDERVLYYQPREHISLSEDDFEAKLPKTAHYSDESVVAFTKQNKALWREAYHQAYENFANHLNTEHFDAVDVPNKPGVSNWVEKHGGLPKYIADIAGDLITERGMTVDHAIATAVSRCKVWAAGGDNVDKKTQAKAAAAIAEWEKKKAETHLSEEELIESFADDGPDGLAKKIVDAWKYTFEPLAGTVVSKLRGIMNRAGQLELRKSHFTTESWNPNDAPADWAQRHAASLVHGVEDTVRNELRRFLANEIRAGHSNQQIAQAVREHFSDFPDWKSDRLARTETMLAYNFATLYAGKSAGVTRVQALDAQNGPTDGECERRNGKIFDIEDAFGENLREHPNGTLSWKLLRSTKLSVQKVPKDQIEDEKLAWYDPISDVIYMAEDIDPSDEERYLLLIGSTLSDSPVD